MLALVLWRYSSAMETRCGELKGELKGGRQEVKQEGEMEGEFS